MRREKFIFVGPFSAFFCREGLTKVKKRGETGEKEASSSCRFGNIAYICTRIKAGKEVKVKNAGSKFSQHKTKVLW